MRTSAFAHAGQATLFPIDLDSETEYWCDWTDEEIEDIGYKMITQALDEVRDRRKSFNMRKEAWDWLMSDAKAPFSSRNCACANGLNIDELRGLLKRIVKDL
jgi:hypothetical protein